VPAGTYLILAKTVMLNSDTSGQYGDCSLSTGDTDRIAFDPGSFHSISLQDSATLSATSAIEMTCHLEGGSGGGALNAVLTAIAVDQLN
jgi:hypothetical protein